MRSFQNRFAAGGSLVAFDVLSWLHFSDDLQGCPNARWQIASWEIINLGPGFPYQTIRTKPKQISEIDTMPYHITHHQAKPHQVILYLPGEYPNAKWQIC